jgi:heme/copper-type cytochrome/quinol oxidase subunit 2
MSRAQRLVFLIIALVIAVIAVVLITTLSTSGGQEVEVAATATPTATATAESPAATKTPAATATPKPAPPLVTGEGIKKLRFKQGDTIRFRVRADVTDEVHVHGYDLMKDLTPGETVTFSFPATITGIFEVEFENAGKQIAQLRVDPD